MWRKFERGWTWGEFRRSPDVARFSRLIPRGALYLSTIFFLLLDVIFVSLIRNHWNEVQRKDLTLSFQETGIGNKDHWLDCCVQIWLPWSMQVIQTAVIEPLIEITWSNSTLIDNLTSDLIGFCVVSLSLISSKQSVSIDPIFSISQPIFIYDLDNLVGPPFPWKTVSFQDNPSSRAQVRLFHSMHSIFLLNVNGFRNLLTTGKQQDHIYTL